MATSFTQYLESTSRSVPRWTQCLTSVRSENRCRNSPTGSKVSRWHNPHVSRAEEGLMLSLDRRYALPVFLAWVLLVAFFAVSELRRSDVRQAAAQIWVATDRVRLLTDLRSMITDAETGQRGYLLTGDEAYLE